MDDVVVSPAVTIPSTELRWRFSRSSGAGGQHVNTSDTRVELSWDLLGSSVLDATQRTRASQRLGRSLVDGAVTVSASDRRSQLRNRELAAQRLADLVAAAIAPPPRRRRPTRPTQAAKRRRAEAKRQRSDVKRLRRPPSAD